MLLPAVIMVTGYTPELVRVIQQIIQIFPGSRLLPGLPPPTRYATDARILKKTGSKSWIFIHFSKLGKCICIVLSDLVRQPPLRNRTFPTRTPRFLNTLQVAKLAATTILPGLTVNAWKATVGAILGLLSDYIGIRKYVI